MKQVVFFTLFFIFLMLPCLAQESITCPKIKVSASKSSYHPGEPMTFSVSTIEDSNNLKLEYEWQISAGKIGQGQGTPSITVESAGLEDTVVTATFKINGLPNNCVSEFYANVTIDPRPPIVDPLEIEVPQTNKEIKARLNIIYSQLINEPTKIAVIINYGTDKQVADRTTQFIRAIKVLKYDRSRFRFVRGGSEPGIRTRCFLIPKTETDTLKP